MVGAGSRTRKTIKDAPWGAWGVRAGAPRRTVVRGGAPVREEGWRGRYGSHFFQVDSLAFAHFSAAFCGSIF